MYQNCDLGFHGELLTISYQDVECYFFVLLDKGDDFKSREGEKKSSKALFFKVSSICKIRRIKFFGNVQSV